MPRDPAGQAGERGDGAPGPLRGVLLGPAHLRHAGAVPTPDLGHQPPVQVEGRGPGPRRADVDSGQQGHAAHSPEPGHRSPPQPRTNWCAWTLSRSA